MNGGTPDFYDENGKHYSHRQSDLMEIVPQPDTSRDEGWTPDLAHAANEWADCACSGLQWLRNVKAGISTASEACDNMERNYKRCQEVQKSAFEASHKDPQP